MNTQVIVTTTSELLDALPQEIDLFLCCASFESRSKIIPQDVSRLNIRASIVFYVEDFEASMSLAIQSITERTRLNATKVALSYFDQNNAGRTLVKVLSRELFNSISNLIIDISTFTREHLLIILKIISIYANRETLVTFIYLGASEYSLGLPVAEKWLSHGVLGTRTVLGYPGIFDAKFPTRVIGLMGFEALRMATIIERFQPSIVRVGKSNIKGSIETIHYEVNTYWHNMLCNTFSNIEEFEYDTRNPSAVYSTLERMIPRSESVNTIIAPLSTKLSTLAAGLLAIHNPSIRLCYAPVIRYNMESYSNPGETVFLISLTGFEIVGNMSNGD